MNTAPTCPELGESTLLSRACFLVQLLSNAVPEALREGCLATRLLLTLIGVTKPETAPLRLGMGITSCRGDLFHMAWMS